MLSLSGLCRAGDTAPETLQEVFRILRPGGLFVFVEPDTVRGQGQSVKELIKKVFPEKIKVQSSPIRNIDTASTSTSLSEDEEFIRSRGKRGATKNKFSKVNSAVIDKAEVSVATVADSIDNNNSNNKLSKTNDDQAAPGIQDTSTITATPDNNLKPGLVVEIHNNLINTYVSGIAVRPY